MTEDEFLHALFARLPVPGAEVTVPPGDDCAALRLTDDSLLLLAVDQIVGDRHYYRRGPRAAGPEQVGRKLLARNLSDIAAMGGTPTACVVATATSEQCDEAWLTRLFEGIAELGREYGVTLVGGDLARTSSDDVGSLTIVGSVRDSQIVRRSGARPGDWLYATGRFGASLETGYHLSFTPRVREGRWLAEERIARAMIDVSDGVLLDARRLCRASGTGLRLDPAALPRRDPRSPGHAVLTDGEDYELLFAVHQEDASRLESAWPFAKTPLTRVGCFVAAAPGTVADPNGEPLGNGGGFDHFSGAPSNEQERQGRRS